ncbi:hypothetical protein EV361DRAFT_202869 [Lentinula raphanica]|nr:hypothetical protein EV361DRAFT_202869 [Lentinula raphanica]
MSKVIVISLSTFTSGEQLNFSVDYPSGYEPPYAMKTENLLTALRDFFKSNVNRVAYTLAQINNYKPTTGVLDLVPQAFCFVTYDVADSDLSFLTLLIQLEAVLVLVTSGTSNLNGSRTGLILPALLQFLAVSPHLSSSMMLSFSSLSSNLAFVKPVRLRKSRFPLRTEWGVSLRNAIGHHRLEGSATIATIQLAITLHIGPCNISGAK